MANVNSIFGTRENEWAEYSGESTDGGTPSKTSSVVMLLVLLAFLGVAIFYGYGVLKNKAVPFSGLFGNQAQVTTLGQRVDAAETRLHELNGGWEGVGQRFSTLEADLNSRISTIDTRIDGSLKQSRKYAETLTRQMHEQVSAEIDARTQPLDARLRQVEAEQSAQQSQLTQVEADLDQNVKQQIGSVREETGRDLAGVRQQVETNSRDVSALSQRMDRQRVDFELTKGQTKEIVPGVSLRVSGTDAAHQRYRGSMWLLKDRRTLWLREQNVHEPVRFFYKDGGDPYELIVTDVTKKSAVGYLLVPVASANQNAEVSGQRTSTAAPGS